MRLILILPFLLLTTACAQDAKERQMNVSASEGSYCYKAAFADLESSLR